MFEDLQKDLGLTYLFIAHDLSVVRYISDRIGVICKGKILEIAPAEELFRHPMHPYTIGLQNSKPTMTLDDNTELYNIPGNVPNPVNMPNHCYFKERCDRCIGKCSGDYPCMKQISPTHLVACHLYGEEETHG